MSCRRYVDCGQPTDQRWGQSPGSGDTTRTHQVLEYLGHDVSTSLLLCNREHFYKSSREPPFSGVIVILSHFLCHEIIHSQQQNSLLCSEPDTLVSVVQLTNAGLHKITDILRHWTLTPLHSKCLLYSLNQQNNLLSFTMKSFLTAVIWEREHCT